MQQVQVRYCLNFKYEHLPNFRFVNHLIYMHLPAYRLAIEAALQAVSGIAVIKCALSRGSSRKANLLKFFVSELELISRLVKSVSSLQMLDSQVIIMICVLNSIPDISLAEICYAKV